jgi:hypothetical protein
MSKKANRTAKAKPLTMTRTTDYVQEPQNKRKSQEGSPTERTILSAELELGIITTAAWRIARLQKQWQERPVTQNRGKTVSLHRVVNA